MKFASCFCLGLMFFDAFAMGDGVSKGGLSPEVYSDISRRAQQNAMKFDGWKLVGGLTYGMSSFYASIRTGSKQTKQNINDFMLTGGVDYSRKIKKNFIIGGAFLLDFWKSQKKTGDMQIFNYDYYARLLDTYYSSSLNTLSGELKMPSFLPELSVRGGYIFQNMGTIAYLKLGLQRIKAKYTYYVDGHQISSLNAIRYIPIFGIGGYKRWSKKFGISFELSLPYKREYEGTTENPTLRHKIKMGRSTIRVLVTYSIPGKMN